MKIKYVWHETPDTEKIIDTVEELKKLPVLIEPLSQEMYDKFIMNKLQRDEADGKILRYEVVEP
jgi:hypothetical protein